MEPHPMLPLQYAVQNQGLKLSSQLAVGFDVHIDRIPYGGPKNRCLDSW